MRKIFCGSLVVTALFFAITSTPVRARTLDARAKKDIDTAAREVVASGKSAGLAVGILVNGELRFHGAYGKSNLETDTPVTENTVFRIASLTKQFTAAGILLLAERGELSVDDKLSKYLPDFPQADQITLHQLLSHTSGVHNFTEGTLTPEMSATGATVSDFVKVIGNQKPLFDYPPGTAYHYSNSGYFLLGAVIEKVTGKSYRQYMQDAIFGPLGMTHTAIDLGEDVVPYRASGYVPLSGKSGFSNADPIAMTIPFAAGAIRSTIGDLALWNRALHSGNLLKPTNRELMITPVRVVDGRSTSAAAWFPAGSKPSTMPTYRSGWDYGYGLQMSMFHGHRTVSHSGGIPGFNSMMEYFPDDKLTVIVLANTRNGAWQLEEGIAAYILAGHPIIIKKQ